MPQPFGDDRMSEASEKDATRPTNHPGFIATAVCKALQPGLAATTAYNQPCLESSLSALLIEVQV